MKVCPVCGHTITDEEKDCIRADLCCPICKITHLSDFINMENRIPLSLPTQNSPLAIVMSKLIQGHVITLDYQQIKLFHPGEVVHLGPYSNVTDEWWLATRMQQDGHDHWLGMDISFSTLINWIQKKIDENSGGSNESRR